MADRIEGNVPLTVDFTNSSLGGKKIKITTTAGESEKDICLKMFDEMYRRSFVLNKINFDIYLIAYIFCN